MLPSSPTERRFPYETPFHESHNIPLAKSTIQANNVLGEGAMEPAFIKGAAPAPRKRLLPRVSRALSPKRDDSVDPLGAPGMRAATGAGLDAGEGLAASQPARPRPPRGSVVGRGPPLAGRQ